MRRVDVFVHRIGFGGSSAPQSLMPAGMPSNLRLDAGTQRMTLRTKLLATIATLYLVALVAIGVYAVRSAIRLPAIEAIPGRPANPSVCTGYSVAEPDGSERIGGPIFQTLEEAAEAALDLNRQFPDRPPARAVCGETQEASRGIRGRAAGTIYERDEIVTALIASALVAIVAVGAVLIWTKSKDAAAAAHAPLLGPDIKPSGTVVPGAQTASDVAIAIPPVDQSRIVESLRRLQALHEEGILTDDEYEAKRKPLTEQL
jgi:hypothetical protein